MRHSHNQRGVGHVGAIVIIAIATLIGVAGWWAQSRRQDNTPAHNANASLTQAIKNANCDYDDTDLCKFFAAWKATTHYTVKAEQQSGSNPMRMTIQSQGKNIVHLVIGGGLRYETIVIGDTTYIKDNRDNTWWKQMHNTNSTYHAAAKDYTAPYEFEEPTQETLGNFKRIGTERHGNTQYIKYEIANPDVPDDKQYIWFDSETYQLHRVQTKGPQNAIFNATFSYENVDIQAPAPTKDLPQGQYILPGQNEPAAIPNLPTQTELNSLIPQN